MDDERMGLQKGGGVRGTERKRVRGGGGGGMVSRGEKRERGVGRGKGYPSAILFEIKDRDIETFFLF